MMKILAADLGKVVVCNSILNTLQVHAYDVHVYICLVAI